MIYCPASAICYQYTRDAWRVLLENLACSLSWRSYLYFISMCGCTALSVKVGKNESQECRCSHWHMISMQATSQGPPTAGMHTRPPASAAARSARLQVLRDDMAAARREPELELGQPTTACAAGGSSTTTSSQPSTRCARTAYVAWVTHVRCNCCCFIKSVRIVVAFLRLYPHIVRHCEILSDSMYVGATRHKFDHIQYSLKV